MRPIERLISTLAPPTTTSKTLFAAPPIVVAKDRIKINGSFLLLSSLDPDLPRRAWLGPAHQITRYRLRDTLNSRFSLQVESALRRFREPTLGTNVARLGALGNPYISRKPHLYEMLMACLGTPEGTRGLFEADVVAELDVIKKLMFPHKASFNASFAQGVLFLEAADELRVSKDVVDRKLGFFRACTTMYAKGSREPRGRVRHTLHSVVTRTLGGLNLVMSSEVDCVRYNDTVDHDTNDPAYYMQLVTRPLRNGQYKISPKSYRNWYIRAKLMGIKALYLGLVDEAGVLRDTRHLARFRLPMDAVAAGGRPWDPAENIHWAFRVLTALRDYCQEATDLHSAMTRQRRSHVVWRVEISPFDGAAPHGGGVRVLVRKLTQTEELPLSGLVPDPVIKAYTDGYP
ncbi:hypothetical protein B0H17DRAFT_70310 [Mycena rosella]|uniref:Decapping nuclease n=1 Tax=Mycena rosella TaxID=1033263 RepID=A0AAD7G9H1_MYCRO|nr:hypothetical protein B0H17DRAFT_70310 [Mycena rosella]